MSVIRFVLPSYTPGLISRYWQACRLIENTEANVISKEFQTTFDVPAKQADGQPNTISITRPDIVPIEPLNYGGANQGVALAEHGTDVLSKVWGKTHGLASRANVIMVKDLRGKPIPDKNVRIRERYLDGIVRVLEDVRRKLDAQNSKRPAGSKKTTVDDVVVNMSFGFNNWGSDALTTKPAFNEILCKSR